MNLRITRDQDGSLCIADSSEGHLAGHLDAEEEHTGHIDPQCMLGKVDQSRV